jgi:hypothetical protein
MTDPHKSRTVHAGAVLVCMAASIAGVWCINQHETKEADSFSIKYQAAVRQSRSTKGEPSAEIASRLNDLDRRLHKLDTRLDDADKSLNDLKVLFAAPAPPASAMDRRANK